MNVLALIPARGGSKGVHKKNIKLLNGKPLIHYTIEAAKQVFAIDDICISTDCTEIIQVAEETGIKVPFQRPDELATDTATTNDVIIHALEFYKNQGKTYDCVVLLQPTSPFRNGNHIKEALGLFKNEIDMVVSVKETESNPYYVLFEENEKGFLEKSKKGEFTRRQDCPMVYELNGAIYVINTTSLMKQKISFFKTVIKYKMDGNLSIDLDTPLDWKFAELLINEK